MAQAEQAIGFDEGKSGKTQSSSVEGGDSASPAPSEGQFQTKDAEKRTNPSAPGETGTTPGTNGK